MALTTTIGPGRLPGRKVQKDRVTFMACTNIDGSEKFPLLVIGKSKRRRCFNSQDPESLGVIYRYNNKSWMNSSTFFEWLNQFDEYIGQTRDRNVLMLLDNAACLGNSGTIPTLNNVQVLFLPPNTASIIQTLDAGIIRSLKNQFRKRQVENALTQIQKKETTDLYKIDLKETLKWMSEIWANLDERNVSNCWYSTGLPIENETEKNGITTKLFEE